MAEIDYIKLFIKDVFRKRKLLAETRDILVYKNISIYLVNLFGGIKIRLIITFKSFEFISDLIEPKKIKNEINEIIKNGARND